MVWACRSLDYLILKWTAVGSNRSALLNDCTHVYEAYFTYRPM